MKKSDFSKIIVENGYGEDAPDNNKNKLRVIKADGVWNPEITKDEKQR